VLANLVEIEVPETVGREIMSVVSVGELSDKVTEDTVVNSMSEVVPMYSVEVHCDTTEQHDEAHSVTVSVTVTVL